MNIFTHDGCVTVKSGKTGEHRTFKIKTQKDDASFAPGERIISMLTGPDNENDYQSFGFVKDNYIVLWNKKKTEFFEKVVKILEKPENFNVELNFEGRCKRCFRLLTTPDSVANGYGPECIKKV